LTSADQDTFIITDAERRARRAFQQGRQKEHTEDASALRADEGRGKAAICVGEPRAGWDPTISEWGNPSVATDTAKSGGHRGN
jgi:hypothetical protein